MNTMIKNIDVKRNGDTIPLHNPSHHKSDKRYEEYKDSGIEWTGNIPSHWRVRRADAIFMHLKNLIRSSELRGQQVYHYSIPAIQEFGECRMEEGSTIDSDKFVIQGNEILFSKLNPRKGTVIISKNHDKLAVCSTEFIVLKPLDGNIKYFFYLLTSNGFKEDVSSRVQSATKSHQRINPSDVYKNMLCFPPLNEQVRISDFLDNRTSQIDTLISKKEKLLELLQEERTAIINQAVTKGLDPNVPMKDSGIEWLGEIPKHWTIKKLKYLLRSIKGGGTPSTDNPKYWNGNIPWVSPKDMKSDVIISSIDYITDIAITESTTSRVREGNVLMVVRSGILKHTLPLAINKVEVALNQDLKAFEANDLMSNPYLFWTLRGLEDVVLTLSKKLGATVDSLDMESLLNLTIPLPPSHEQQQIISKIRASLDHLQSIQSKIEREIELLLEYKNALVSEAVTGKIDVRQEALIES